MNDVVLITPDKIKKCSSLGINISKRPKMEEIENIEYMSQYFDITPNVSNKEFHVVFNALYKLLRSLSKKMGYNAKEAYCIPEDNLGVFKYQLLIIKKFDMLNESVIREIASLLQKHNEWGCIINVDVPTDISEAIVVYSDCVRIGGAKNADTLASILARIANRANEYTKKVNDYEEAEFNKMKTLLPQALSAYNNSKKPTFICRGWSYKYQKDPKQISRCINFWVIIPRSLIFNIKINENAWENSTYRLVNGVLVKNDWKGKDENYYVAEFCTNEILHKQITLHFVDGTTLSCSIEDLTRQDNHI